MKKTSLKNSMQIQRCTYCFIYLWLLKARGKTSKKMFSIIKCIYFARWEFFMYCHFHCTQFAVLITSNQNHTFTLRIETRDFRNIRLLDYYICMLVKSWSDAFVSHFQAFLFNQKLQKSCALQDESLNASKNQAFPGTRVLTKASDATKAV